MTHHRLWALVLAILVVALIATSLSCIPKSHCRGLVSQTVAPAPEGQQTTLVQGLVTWRFEPVIGAVVKVWDLPPQRPTPDAYPEVGFLARAATHIDGRFRVELPQGSSPVWLTVEAAGLLPSDSLQFAREGPAIINITLRLCIDPRTEFGTDAGTWPPMIDYRSTSD